MSLEKPDRKRPAKMAAPSRQRSPQRRAEAPQVKMVISREARLYLAAIQRRSGVPQNLIVNALILDAQRVERIVHEMGFAHVGEALAVLKDRRER